MLEFLKNHFDIKIRKTTVFGILTAMAIIPCVLYLPQKYGYENGLLENIQMFVLFLGLYFSFSSKVDKKFFYFAGMVLIILMIREVNCGRTLFFPIPGVEHAYYSWKDIKYGYLAHPIYGIYIASVVIYFLKNKLFKDLIGIIKTVKFPIWEISLMLTGMITGLYAEHSFHNMVLEETTELLFYVSLVGIIWIYTRERVEKIR